MGWNLNTLIQGNSDCKIYSFYPIYRCFNGINRESSTNNCYAYLNANGNIDN